MTNDQKTTIAGAIGAVGLLLAAFFPAQEAIIRQICGGIGAIAIAVLGYYTNKA